MNIVRLKEDAIIPTKGHKTDAGFDLYSTEKAVINPHETVMIGTGIAIELPENTFGAIFARSGIASRFGLRPANCVGVIDNSYRGEIIVALHNDANTYRTIAIGDRIAQLVVMPYLNVDLNVVDKLSDTERGSGGFGSTGQ